MKFLKKNVFKIAIFFILLSISILCLYTICNYNNSTVNIQNKIQQINNQNTVKPAENPPSLNGSKLMQKGDKQHNPNSNHFGGPQQSFQQNVKSSTTSNLAPLLIVYGIIFLAIFIGVYYFIKYKKLRIEPKNEKILIATLLIVGLLLRIILGTLMQGYQGDINLFKNWAISAANGLSQFYSSSKSSDYPPLYIYILFIVGKIASIGSISKYYILLLKLPSILADIVTSYFIYKIAKKHVSSEISILLSAFYIFNPAVFINSTLWGQVDSFFTLIIVVAVFLLSEKKIGFASGLFTAAVLMKPQGIIFFPVLFFELVRQKKLKNFVKAAVIVFLVSMIIILPFSGNKNLLWIFNLYSTTVSEYPYASMNAFNFFSLIGANHVKDSLTLFIFSYHSWGMIFIIMTTLFSWYVYIKGKNSIIAPIAALIQISGVFTFSVGMHERYLFPAVALAILSFIYLKDKRILWLFLGFSITVYLNTHMVLFESLKGNINGISYNPMLMAVSFLNIALFSYLIKIALDIAKRKRIIT